MSCMEISRVYVMGYTSDLLLRAECKAWFLGGIVDVIALEDLLDATDKIVSYDIVLTRIERMIGA